MDCRCKFCNKLLCKITKNEKGVRVDGVEEKQSIIVHNFVVAEIKCSKCKTKNTFKI